jgi:hypothetical protein
LFSPFTAWLPGGAKIFQPCIRWPGCIQNLLARSITLIS